MKKLVRYGRPVSLLFTKRGKVAYKPYLCISCSLTPGVKRWIRTFKSSGVSSQVRLLVFMWKPYFEAELKEFLSEGDYVIYKQDSDFTGNVAALMPFLKLLKSKDYSEDWFIWVDCHDVVFQRTMYPFWDDQGFSVVLSSEYARHEELSEYWGSIIKACPSRDFEFLLNRTIYNGGCFAMKAPYFCDYLVSLNEYYRCYGDFKGFSYNGVQLFFNKWVQKHIFSCIVLSDFLNLCSGYLKAGFKDPAEVSGVSEVKDGKFVDPVGQLFTIVHANGETKKILDQLYKEEGHGMP